MEVTYVQDEYNGDWVGLYVDGKLVDESHSLDPQRVMDALGIKYESRAVYMVNIGRLPERLEDAPFEIEEEEDG